MEEIIFEYLAREMEISKQEEALDREYTRLEGVAKGLEDWLKENGEPVTGYVTLEGRFYEYQVGYSSSGKRNGYRVRLREIHVLGGESG